MCISERMKRLMINDLWVYIPKEGRSNDFKLIWIDMSSSEIWIQLLFLCSLYQIFSLGSLYEAKDEIYGNVRYAAIARECWKND